MSDDPEELQNQLLDLARSMGELVATDEPGKPVTREQLEEGLRFVHLVLAHVRDQLSTLNVGHETLIKALADRDAIDQELIESHRELPVLRERKRRADQPDLRLAPADDKYEVPEVEIDCIERLPLCKARCCTLDHELSEQDLDERVVRWDYGRPYVIAKNKAGMCVHNRQGQCTVYGARPASCRRYDCRDDRRIWLDFDNRIPAP